VDEKVTVNQVSIEMPAGQHNLLSAKQFLEKYSLNERMKLILGNNVTFLNVEGDNIKISQAKFQKT